MFYPKYSRRAAPKIKTIQNSHYYSEVEIAYPAPICPTSATAEKKIMQKTFFYWW